MRCEKCGAEMKVRKRLSGEKEGHRYYVCMNWPKCKTQKSYAEQGQPHKWNLIEGKFRFLPRK